MGYSANTKIIDPRTGTNFAAQVSPIGDLLVQEPIRIVGPNFVGATLDTNFWNTTGIANGGTVAIANSVATLSTLTTANGTAQLNSVRNGRFMFAHPNKFRIITRNPTTGSANNAKRWGVDNGTDGFGFYVSGASANIGVYTRTGGAATVDTTTLNVLGTTQALTTNPTVYEIVYYKVAVYWFINGVLVHQNLMASLTAPLVNELSLPIRCSNTNSAGSTTAVVMDVWDASILRLGRDVALPRFVAYTTTQTATILKRGPGTLHGVFGGSGSASETIILYDALSATNPIITIDCAKAPGFAATAMNIEFQTGLTLTTTSNAYATVTYD